MKYAVVKTINGNYFIHGEYGTNLEGAKVAFHALCQTLWNAQDVEKAVVKIVDENLDCVERYMEHVTHGVEEGENDSEDI